MQLWSCAKPCHIKQIQTFQNKSLRNIVYAGWDCKNSDCIVMHCCITKTKEDGLKEKNLTSLGGVLVTFAVLQCWCN